MIPTHTAKHIAKSHKPKIAKEYVFADADRQAELKSQQRTRVNPCTSP